MNRIKKLAFVMLLLFVGFSANSQNKSDVKEEAIFSFNDGQTIYTLYKVTPEKAPAANEPPYSKKVVPDFEHKITVRDKPVIDTIYDARDPSIVLALNTLIDKDFTYAKKFSFSYDILSQEFQNLLDMAKDQGIEVVETKFVLLWDEGFYNARWTLPKADELDGATKICLTIRLRKNGLSMDYPVFFGD